VAAVIVWRAAPCISFTAMVPLARNSLATAMPAS
jgi:hypothetical protein